MLSRFAANNVEEALADTPVVFIIPSLCSARANFGERLFAVPVGALWS